MIEKEVNRIVNNLGGVLTVPSNHWKRLSRIMAVTIVLMLLLPACNPPVPISDAQLKVIAELCASKGLAVKIYNNLAVSTAECVRP